MGLINVTTPPKVNNELAPFEFTTCITQRVYPDGRVFIVNKWISQKRKVKYKPKKEKVELDAKEEEVVEL